MILRNTFPLKQGLEKEAKKFQSYISSIGKSGATEVGIVKVDRPLLQNLIPKANGTGNKIETIA